MSILASKYKAIRTTTHFLVRGLSAEDQMVQSSPEASPVKWHQAHTTWFFETFVLRPFLADYKPFHVEFCRLFDSHYTSLDEEISERVLLSSFSRPSLNEILAYRAHVDVEMGRLFTRSIDDEALRRILVGLNHEQQHQEQMLADIKHAFFANPLHPLYEEDSLKDEPGRTIPKLGWHTIHSGLIEIGHRLNPDDPLDFCFDNETPRHKTLLTPFQIANRKVTCREYLEFISDDAYMRPELWLTDGWEMVKQAGWEAPLYWDRDPGKKTGWRVFTLRGWYNLFVLLDTPVCHISFFEADAFARWRGCRLPTEAEWEFVAGRQPHNGNLLDSGRLHPAAAISDEVQQFFGDCWEWTASAYTGYPGYKPLPCAVEECGGKFMSGQMILRGGSCVTPADHIRASYRKFLPPATRRQFTGMRLAA